MHAETTLSARELRALWRECAASDDVPDHYELTEHGEMVMSPKPTNRHQLICAEIAFQLRSQLGGKAVVEAAVLTATAGVRVPDVVWMPEARWSVVTTEAELIEGPEFVAEVLSPGNRAAEVAHKVRAYLDSGVREVLIVGLDGSLRFHRVDGVHDASSFGIRLVLAKDLFR